MFNRRRAGAIALVFSTLTWGGPAFAGDATLSWDPNPEPDLAGYRVHYGQSSGTYATTVDVNMATTHVITGLGLGTYYFAVTAYDTAGNESGFSNEGSKTFVDTTAPVISAIASGAVTSAGAAITWTTNEAATSLVQYGTTTAYGSSSSPGTTLVTAHSRTLTGLTPATLYHYRVQSVDAAGNTAASADNTFTTLAAPDTTPPALSGIAVGTITSSGAVVTWTTNEAATSLVEYGTTTGYGSSSTLNSSPVTSHSRTLSGLAASTLYHYRVKSTDAAGNLATSGDLTLTTLVAPDTTAPTISGVTASNLSATGAIITWGTNEAATSQVEYGTTTGYGSSSTLNSSPVTSHSRTLSGLAASTTYHYRVKSTDAAGNAATSGDFTFATLAAPDTTAPTIASVAASAITFNSAQITWTTNEAATSLVQYGTTTAYGSSSSLGTTLVTAHSRTLTGLTPVTLYHYRVQNVDAAGNTATSGDLTFTTEPAPDTTPPALSSIAVGTITSSGAVVTWATNEAATSLVEYGTTTAYGSSSALGSSAVTSHSRTLSGLAASTTYHYRVKSTDAAGNQAVSGDLTFTTAPAPDTTPPTISAVAASNLSVTGATITWTTNEAASSQVEYGTTTAYGSSSTLNSSPVTSHSRTLSGLTASTLYHYRVKSTDAAGNQAVSGDLTFTTVAAPDTTPPTISGVAASNLSATGAIITWSTNEAATSQVEYGTTTGYGSSSTLNSSPVTSHSRTLSGLAASTLYHYRVKSTDAAGNLAVSSDLTFSTSSAPDTAPPTLASIAASGITFNSAQITWTTNEAATSLVQYGTTTAYGTSSPGTTLVTAHSRTLTGLTPATLYHYRVQSTDAAGNTTTSGDLTFTTLAAPDTTAPTISGVTASNLSATGAIITWSTNEAATSQVEYGTTTGYGSSSTLNSSPVTGHSRTLSGLAASTTYHYRVKSTDAAGNLATSSDFTFATPAAPDTTPPTIANIAASAITFNSAQMTWATNEAASSQVEYGTTTSYGSSSTLNSSPVTSHSRTLSGLAASTLYHYRVKSTDAAGNQAVSGDLTFTTLAAPDTTPPTISGVTASNLSATGAIITWSTNEAATSQVEYGTTTAYGSSSILNSGPVTGHSRTLSGLAASTTYHYRVKSTDAAGNLATSGDFTFATLAAPDTTAPTIASVAASAITFNSAQITWTTNEAATSLVQYGTTTAYGSSSSLGTTLVTAHSRTLTGLTPATLYHYRVQSVDAAGNTATSGDLTFTTLATPDTTPPTISGVAATSITATSAVITWTTSEPASSAVEHGPTTAYGARTPLNATLVTSHTVTLAGLTAQTTHYFRVLSTDAAGNAATSTGYTFATTAVLDTRPPGDVRDFVARGGARRVVLRWINPPDADFVGVRLRYRTDRFPSGSEDGTLLGDVAGPAGEEWSFTHLYLTNGVTYYYSAAAYDAHGNQQNTVFASGTPFEQTVDADPEAPGGCGMILPRDGGRPPGPGQAADLLILVVVALLMMGRNRIFGASMRQV